MCFSIEADLIVGVSLLPVGVLSLREVRHVREVPFASLPLLFALHQLVESLVWAGSTGAVCPSVQAGASLAYVLFALPVLPLLVPLAVLLALGLAGSALAVARVSRIDPLIALGGN